MNRTETVYTNIKCIEAKYQRDEPQRPSDDTVPGIIVALTIARARREGR